MRLHTFVRRSFHVWAVLLSVIFAGNCLGGSSIPINPRPEPRPNTGGFHYQFSNDGRSLILEDQGVLYRMPFRTGSLDPIGPTGVYDFRLSEMGGTIVYSFWTHNSDHDVYAINTEGGTPVDLGLSVYNGLSNTYITPDTDAFIDHNGGKIIRQPLDGSEPTILAADTGYANDYLLAPDGTQVVYEYAVVGETARLYRVPATGGAPVELPLFVSLYMTFISPDSSLLINKEGFIIPFGGGGPVVDYRGGDGDTANAF